MSFRVLITAGPTREHLDPVRYLSNGSSGKMGYALARAALERGAKVDLVSGPVAIPAPLGAHLHAVVSAQQMYAAAAALFPFCDAFFAVAAVADYRPRVVSERKLKKADQTLTIELEPTIDILKTLAAKKTAHQIVVGFAAETNDVESYARKKLIEKKLDWIVANDVGHPGIGMDAEANAVTIFSAAGEKKVFGPAPKLEVARFILDTLRIGAR